ncbi:MAG: galactokinase [Clostridia bacterium]|nr:galactokinase [Clostridia bacterium]
MNSVELCAFLERGDFDRELCALYGAQALEVQRKRYLDAARSFLQLYGEMPSVHMFTSAGRTEISGNHTDHNRGCVIAASVDLDIIAVAAKTDTDTVTVQSEGYGVDTVPCKVGAPDSEKYYTSASLIAGVLRGFSDRGLQIGGFCAYTTSNVLGGSGLSSSAAFENMIGTILDGLYNENSISNRELACISQFSENVYFGKPSGLMDQMACGVGGMVAIDFADPKAPVVEQMYFDPAAYGYRLCIVSTGGSHADLNEDYASIPREMKAVAAFFGKEVLREVAYGDFCQSISELRTQCGDRAVLRAMHFFAENDRVRAQIQALHRGDFEAFLSGVLASGASGCAYLQNIYTTKDVSQQPISLALALSESYLKPRGGAWRVHGGGFAGTIQAYVRVEDAEEYRARMDSVFGDGACVLLGTRAVGAGMLL